MGVRGLKSFIEKNDDLFVKQYHLHDSVVVIDASNLICALYIKSQKHERRDLFGGDMVQFGHYLNGFFNNLKRCNIVPILVFDGAQTYDENKSKTAEKYRRALERFQSVISISRCGFGDFILPATATNVFRSILVDRGLKIVQCMYEADLEVARIANEHKGPVLSNDSDFFLMGLKYGVLTIDLMEHEQVKRSFSVSDSTRDQRDHTSYLYIECSLFKQEKFANYLPQLNLMNLPLLGILAGNDFIEPRIFERICGQLATRRIGSIRQFKRTASKQHDKIIKILYFLCGKTLNETVNQICLNVPKERRQQLKHLIRSNLDVYDVPDEDDFRSELTRLYWPGFKSTFKHSLQNDHSLIKQKFESTIDSLHQWLKRAMEHSVLSYRCLELANNNIIFIICHLDDPQLPSAHLCQMRPMRVMLTLLRSSYDDPSICVYDRVRNKYEKLIVCPLKYLDHFGQIDHTFYDVIEMKREVRRAILLATFHCPQHVFDSFLEIYCYWMDPCHAEEFLVVKFLMDFVDLENQQVRLWKHFRQATLLCFLYHIYKDKLDKTFEASLESENPIDENFMTNLVDLVKNRKFYRTPTMSRKRRYNCRLMHQITQVQSSIISFNGLNAFLGDVMIRVRTENWLNSCIIYNLAEGLHDRTLKFPNMPEIVYNIPRFDKRQ